MFIDARNLGSSVTRTLKEFSDAEIQRIAQTVHSFQANENYEDEIGFCRAADLSDIRSKNYNISPSKYITGAVDASNIDDYVDIVDKFTQELSDYKNRILLTKMSVNLSSITKVASDAKGLSFASNLSLPNIWSLSKDTTSSLLYSVEQVSELQTNALNMYLQFTESLFKYWFVDFNFPNPEGLPYLESGGEMISSPYGDIPAAWKSVALGNVLQIRNERVGDIENIPEYSTTNRGIQPRSEKFSRSITANSSKNKLVHRGDLVFGMSREILNFGVMKDLIGSVSPAYHVYCIDKKQINPEFLEIYMRICDDYFLSLIKPGAREGQVLDKDEVDSKMILCPPLELQNQYILTRKLLSQLIISTW